MPAHAADDVRIEWVATPGCDARARVERRVEADLGAARMPATRVVVTASGAGDEWHAALSITGATELNREVTAESCETLADAVAIVTVVALDPFALARSVEPLPAPAKGVAPTPVPRRPPTAAVVTPTPRSRVRPHAALRLELGASAFSLPQVGAQLGIAPIVVLRRARFELPVRWRAPSDRAAPEGVTVRMQQVTLGPRGCWVPTRGAIGLLVCGGLDAGLIAARGRGAALAKQRTAVQPWLAVTGAIGASWRVNRRFATWLAVEGSVATLQTTFHLREPGDVWQGARAALLAAIGGELHFPR